MTPLTRSLLRCELVTICAGFSLDLSCLWPRRISLPGPSRVNQYYPLLLSLSLSLSPRDATTPCYLSLFRSHVHTGSYASQGPSYRRLSNNRYLSRLTFRGRGLSLIRSDHIPLHPRSMFSMPRKLPLYYILVQFSINPTIDIMIQLIILNI